MRSRSERLQTRSDQRFEACLILGETANPLRQLIVGHGIEIMCPAKIGFGKGRRTWRSRLAEIDAPFDIACAGREFLEQSR